MQIASIYKPLQEYTPSLLGSTLPHKSGKHSRQMVYLAASIIIKYIRLAFSMTTDVYV